MDPTDKKKLHIDPSVANQYGATYSVVRNRIPHEFVEVKGAAQTSFGPGEDPWETAAYDAALLDAGIEIANCNIVKYTSVIPPEATHITMKEAIERGLFHHGMELCTIMAQMNGVKKQHLCAGVGTCKVYDGEHLVGGFAAEFEDEASREFARRQLQRALEGIFERRYGDQSGYRMEIDYIETQDLQVDEDFGTVFVALCFLTFVQRFEPVYE